MLDCGRSAEVIGVSQDALGRQGSLLAGGSLSIAPRGLGEHLARRHNGSVPDPRKVLSRSELRRLRGSKWKNTDSNTPVTTTACTGITTQQWQWNVRYAYKQLSMCCETQPMVSTVPLAICRISHAIGVCSAPGYLSNAATELCMNVDDCGTEIIAFTCVTTGGTCCGASCYEGLQFVLEVDGSLRTPRRSIE